MAPALQPHVLMLTRPGGGSLAVTASLAAISGQARGEHYAASKGGLISMMKALAVELARHGVRANAILPGWIETAMTERAFACTASICSRSPAWARTP